MVRSRQPIELVGSPTESGATGVSRPRPGKCERIARREMAALRDVDAARLSNASWERPLLVKTLTEPVTIPEFFIEPLKITTFGQPLSLSLRLPVAD